MSRTVKEYRYQMLPPYFQQQLEQLLASEGYKPYLDKGVQVYKYGSGWMTGPKFFAVTIFPNVIRIEGWIKMAILPGVYCGESKLSGFYGSIPKASAKMTLELMERFLYSVGVTPMETPAYPQQNVPPQGYQPQQNYQPQGYQAPQGYQPQNYQQPQQPMYAQPQQPTYAQPQQPSFVTCTQCGARASADAPFCAACGNRLR